MRAFAAALIAGQRRAATPQAAWPGTRRGAWRRWLACAPVVVLWAVVVAATALGAVQVAAWPGWQAIGLAAGATLLCLVLALPSALTGPSIAWIVPLWLAPSIGVTGWALLPLPVGPPSAVGRAVALTLPVMALALSAVLTRFPTGQARAAAACGAGPGTRVKLALREVIPGAAGACLLVFIIALQLMGPA